MNLRELQYIAICATDTRPSPAPSKPPVLETQQQPQSISLQ
jgi:hypothetical protein